MSIFRTYEIPCPQCGGVVAFDLVHSINADRMPAYRDEILAGEFQMRTCSECEHEFRIEPEFNYVDLGRKLWVAAWPERELPQWVSKAEQTSQLFAGSFGSEAPPAARDLAEGVSVRMTFGWAALVEKIIANELGVDDTTLEVVKATLMRHSKRLPAMGSQLRLMGEEDGELVFGWFSHGNEEMSTALRIHRGIVDEVEADPEPFAAVREAVGPEPFVDLQRMTVATA